MLTPVKPILPSIQLRQSAREDESRGGMGPSRLTTRTGQDEADFVEMLGVSLKPQLLNPTLFFLVLISNSVLHGVFEIESVVYMIHADRA